MSTSKPQGAIRNVGELASPYYLLELWARKEEVDIDPETYATLKRKARKLVRDARIFDARGELPDDEWLQRRLELLDLREGGNEKTFKLEDGSDFPLIIWSDPEGRESLLVAQLQDFANADARAVDETDPFSTRFELALDLYDGNADWGLLLAWPEIRVYRRSSGISQQFIAVNLESLVELDDDLNWRAFAGLFRSPAFIQDDSGIPLIRRVVDESRRHATRLAHDMRADVVHAAEAIIQGALDHPSNKEILFDGEPTRDQLHTLFEDTLYYLYRLLFILYAEARDVLPLSGAGPYADTYSADHLIERARIEPESAEGTYYSDALRRLFKLLWDGPAVSTGPLGFDPVGGELFDPSRTELLDRCQIGDAAWRQALTSVALGEPKSERRKLGRRSSFAELDVDQLGSIYEGLLVLEPFLSPGSRLVVKENGDRRVVEPGGEGKLKVLRNLEAGDFVLESASGRRKGTGSFYTPAEITEYLAKAATQPLVEPLLVQAETNRSAAEALLLNLKICDPAMGSGAFLVQTARVLGRSLARIRAMSGDGRVTPEMVKRAERDVIRNCLYGVDLNPLAVSLAKVSLWLETLEKGQPLSFLDAHLRVGDSLVGVEFISPLGTLTAASLSNWPKDAPKGFINYLKKEAGTKGKPILDRLAKRKETVSPKQDRLPGLDVTSIEKALAEIATEREALAKGDASAELLQLELKVARVFNELERAEDSLRNRLRRAADFWCAQWFWEEDLWSDDSGQPLVPASHADYEEIVSKIISAEAIPSRLEPLYDAARRISLRHHFFHWALEFPEVIVDRGGFDAVIGNPPWNEINPTARDFFSTYDLEGFKGSVPRTDQDRKKEELRMDPEIDAAWRSEARFLNQLSSYAKPESSNFLWFASEGQLRKGDQNVFRLFVERAFNLLRLKGRLALVLPESLYISSPSTGVRQRLLNEGTVERCYVFENRKSLFPIGTNIKIVLLTARRGDGPTEKFRAAFYVGKDLEGRDRAVALEELPHVLAQLDENASTLSIDQIRLLAPETWSFPEIQTARDAEIAARCARAAPRLADGWSLTFCRELDAKGERWDFRSAAQLEGDGLALKSIRWVSSETWYPVLGGYLINNLEFPAEGQVIQYWLCETELRSVKSRKNSDASTVFDYYRVAWRKIARSTDERSVIATVLPPDTAAKNTCLTVWGGSLSPEKTIALAGLMSSFCFDYLHRFRGTVDLTYGVIQSIPAVPFDQIAHIVPVVAKILAQQSEFLPLYEMLKLDEDRLELDRWGTGMLRARVDAEVALAYSLTLEDYAAVLATFPKLDRTQPMLPGEPKSFVTRDLALFAYCEETGIETADIVELSEAIDVDVPEPCPEFRRLDSRVARYKELGAIPYRPTPRGGRKPTDPQLLEDVMAVLKSEPQTAADIAEAIDGDEKVIAAVMKTLINEERAFGEGKGKAQRFYVLEVEG